MKKSEEHPVLTLWIDPEGMCRSPREHLSGALDHCRSGISTGVTKKKKNVSLQGRWKVSWVDGWMFSVGWTGKQ